MTTAEGKVKTDIRKFLTANGIFWTSVQNGFGAKPGDPDLVLCYKGRFIAIEAKSPTGRQSPMQKTRENEINQNGGYYFIVRSLDDLKSVLKGLEAIL